jgi:hypothetical protein
MNDSLVREVTRVAIYTLSSLVLVLSIVLLYGLFDDKVDNNKIFEVFAPAFQMVIGSFVGFLGGIQVGRKDND